MNKFMLLTGFARCGHCGRPLTGNSTSGRIYYRHCIYKKADCVFHSMREQELVHPVLDYLFSFFTDEPTFIASVERALPSKNERESLVSEQEQVTANLAKANKQVARLVDAITAGADPALLIEKQNDLKAQCDRYKQRLAAIEAALIHMPDVDALTHKAAAIRLQLLKKVRERDWRKLSDEEIRRFLIFLFGENPGKKGNGITVYRDQGRWRLLFKGIVEFHHELADGQPHSLVVQKAAKHYNKQAKQRLEEVVALTRETSSTFEAS
jgi:hypothetical protein